MGAGLKQKGLDLFWGKKKEVTTKENEKNKMFSIKVICIAKKWGSVSGFLAAEPFILVRQLVKKI